MFACTLACLTAGSRMLLSLGHDGLLPKVFTRTSRHTNAPDIAIWAVAIPMTVIPAACIMAGSTDTVLTAEVGTLATYGFMLAYALVSVAAPVFLAKRRTPKPLTLVLRRTRPDVIDSAGRWGELASLPNRPGHQAAHDTCGGLRCSCADGAGSSAGSRDQPFPGPGARCAAAASGEGSPSTPTIRA